MSKTAAKQRVSAKRGFANGRGNLFRLLLAATHGTCGFVNGCPVNSDETTAAKQRVSAKRGFANGRGNLFGAVHEGLL